MRRFVPVISLAVAMLCCAGANAAITPLPPGAASAKVSESLKTGKTLDATVLALKGQTLTLTQIAAALLDASVPASKALPALVAAGFDRDESIAALIAAGADPSSVLPATAAGPGSAGVAGLNANTSPAPALTTPSFGGGGGSTASRR